MRPEAARSLGRTARCCSGPEARHPHSRRPPTNATSRPSSLQPRPARQRSSVRRYSTSSMKAATVMWDHKFKLAFLVVLAIYLIQFAFFTLPRANAAATVVILTSGTSYTVPSDWNIVNNTIEVIGGGGGAANGAINSRSGGAGGGGAYAVSVNVSLTPSASVSYSIGSGGAPGSTGGNGGDTFFCNSTSNCASISGTAVRVGAKGGSGAISSSGVTGGAGGVAASSVGSTTASGGAGGSGRIISVDCGQGGGGGGGAHGYSGSSETLANDMQIGSGGGGGGALAASTAGSGGGGASYGGGGGGGGGSSAAAGNGASG